MIYFLLCMGYFSPQNFIYKFKQYKKLLQSFTIYSWYPRKCSKQTVYAVVKCQNIKGKTYLKCPSCSSTLNATYEYKMFQVE